MLKLSKSKLFNRYLPMFLSVVLIVSAVFAWQIFHKSSNQAEAAWFDDTWGYRQAVTVTISTSASDITELQTLITVDTDDLITAGKLQSSCQDLRFTNKSGDILPYYIDSGCNGNSTKVWLLLDLVPKNTTTYTVYMYYGNLSAVAGSNSQPYFDNLVGLVGYWPMNESSWTNNCSTLSILDASINANNAKACPNSTGPTGGNTGQYGNGGTFDSSNDYAQTNSTVSATLPATFSVWVKPTSWLTSGVIFELSDNNGIIGGLETEGVGSNLSLWWQTDFGHFVSIHCTNPTVGSWTHVVATISSASTASMSMYYNGVKQTCTPASAGSPGSSITQKILFASRDTVNYHFDGTMDDVRVYNRALSQSQVTGLYNSTDKIQTASTTTSSPSTSFATEEKGPGTTLYWKLDDATGTTAQDSSSNNLDGTLNNTPTWQSEDQCIAGKCLYFNGTTDESVSKSDDAKLDFAASDNFTIQAWVKRNGASSANNFILTKAQAGYTGYKLYQDASGDYCFDVRDGTNTDTACTSAVEFDDDKWHLVQGVKTGTTNITLFVDGKQRAQDSSISATATLANSGALYVGADLDGATEWLGFIDEVKVYPYARSSAQINADYNARGTDVGAGSSLGGSASNLPAALSNGLVGYWKMNESSWNGTSNEVVDASGVGNHGTSVSGATTGAGKFGNGGSFDGSGGDYIDAGSGSSMNVTTTWTISTWINPVSLSNYASIFNKRNGSNNTGIDLEPNADGTIKIATPASSGSLTTAVSNGVWTHITATYDGATLKLYKNGVEVGSVAKPDPAISGGSNNAVIGKNSVNSDIFNGKIDELRLYNRALTSAEVAQLYNFAPGPVAYWKMDERSGTTISDSSGNANTSSAFTGNTTWTNGKYGGGLTFDGNDDVVRIPETTSTDLGATTDSYTVSAWVKSTTDDSNFKAVVAKDGTGGSFPFLLYLGTSENVCFQMSGSGNPFQCGGSSLADGRWHYITGVRNVSTDTIYLYADGILNNTTSDTTTATAANNADISIGNGANSYNSYDFPGQIDEVKIYNYARTPAQILEDMNAGHPAPGSPVGSQVAYWKFDQGFGTNAEDSSINNNDLTLNTASWTNSGKFGKAWNGTGGAIRMSRTTDADLEFAAAEDFAISTWFKTDSATNPSTQEYIVSDTTANADVGFNIYANTSGQFCFGIDDDTTWGPDDSACSSTDFYDSAWHHLVATKASTTAITLYIDGKQVASDTSISATGTLDGNNTFYVGDIDTSDDGEEFSGDLDEMKVYRALLTPEQIKLEYNRGSALVLGSAGNNSTYEKQAANQEYCVPGDTTSCASPVLRFDLEEGMGVTANDTSGNSNVGTLTNTPIWMKGKIGKAVNFDGTNDYINVPEATAFDFGDVDFTVGFWMKSNTTSRDAIIAKHSCGSSNGFFFITNDNGSYTNKVGFYVVTSVAYTTSNVIGDGRWHHITGTFTASSNSIDLYVDGKKEATTSGVGGVANNIAFQIGGIVGGSCTDTSAPYEGAIDNIKVYNYIRTPAQIALEYNKGLPIGWWKMDECQGTIANDSSGNNNSGTITPGASGTYTSVGTCVSSSASSMWYNGRNGKVNSSLAFDGTDSYVDVGDLGINDDSDPFTQELWFKTPSVFGATHVLIANNDGSPACSGQYDTYTHTNTDGTVTFRVERVQSWGGAVVSPVLATNTWYHIITTYDGSRNQSGMKIYINGVGTTGSSSAFGAAGSSVDTWAIGAVKRCGSVVEAYVAGLIDNVRIYNYALTASQIQTLYTGGAARFGPSSGVP